ncbi:MAG: ABC transporter permease [Actinomycetota bacterium]|nr:ABC transporter permease [Actinomycetota bacterium]
MSARDDRRTRVDRIGRALTESARVQPVLVPVLAVLVALVVAAIVVVAIGKDPLESYWALLRGMYGTGDRVAASLARSTPFVGAALAVAFAFRAGLFNIGVEGQLLVGATTAAWVGTFSWLADVPAPLLVPIVILAGALGGGLWGGIPGVLKARTGAHEVIVTIMLNSIAVLYVRWLVSSSDPLILRDTGASVPRTAPVHEAARLPVLVDSEPPLHVGALVVVGLCVLVWFVLRRTTFGFEVRTVGTNPNAAKYAGMGVNRTIVLVMLLSGGLAGIAGAGEVLGTSGYLSPGVFVALGFDAIGIALLARANPFAIILTSILWGSMLSGAGLMQQEAGLSIDAVRIIQALVLLLVAADVVVRTIFRLRTPSVDGDDPKGAIDPLATSQVGSGWAGPT